MQKPSNIACLDQNILFLRSQEVKKIELLIYSVNSSNLFLTCFLDSAVTQYMQVYAVNGCAKLKCWSQE